MVGVAPLVKLNLNFHGMWPPTSCNNQSIHLASLPCTRASFQRRICTLKSERSTCDHHLWSLPPSMKWRNDALTHAMVNDAMVKHAITHDVVHDALSHGMSQDRRPYIPWPMSWKLCSKRLWGRSCIWSCVASDDGIARQRQRRARFSTCWIFWCFF